MSWIETIIFYWKEVAILASPVIGWLIGRKSRDTKEKIEEINLASSTIDLYKKMFLDFSNKLDSLESSKESLTTQIVELDRKYAEILLRNALLEERAETYESKYKTLEKDYSKLKSDHDKLHKENKEIRKELDEIKNGNS